MTQPKGVTKLRHGPTKARPKGMHLSKGRQWWWEDELPVNKARAKREEREDILDQLDDMTESEFHKMCIGGTYDPPEQADVRG